MANIRLPTVKKLTDDPRQEMVCSVAHSRVVLQSLRQSRERWLNALPKFSSKSRSTKNPGVTPPPHSPETLGHCDIYIGPHVFYQTAMYKINYYPLTQQASTYYTPQPPWGSSTSYGTTPYGTTPYYQSTTQSQESSNPLVTITPELLTRVTTAGTTNPTLANLLRLAAARQATQEELKRLGALIQSLAAVPEEVFLAQPTSQQIPSAPIKPPDLVIEFRERAGTQFLLRRGPSLCERVESATGSSGHDILLTTCLRVPKATAPISLDGQSPPEETEDVVTFRFANAPEEFWRFLLSWVGDSTEENQKTIERKLAKLPARRYLKHQLPEGNEILAKLRNIPPPFSMKSIQPSKSSEAAARRRHTQLSEGRIRSRSTSNPSTPGPDRSPEKRKRAPKLPQDSVPNV